VGSVDTISAIYVSFGWRQNSKELEVYHRLIRNIGIF
jgi:hypothetical protein